MNKDIIKGKWNEIKGKIKTNWGKLTDDEVTQLEGSYDQLSGIIQQKYGYKKDEAEKEIHHFLEKHGWYKNPVST